MKRLIFPLLLLFIASSHKSVFAGPLFPEFLDPHPNEGNRFGTHIVPLSTGNVVITSPFDDAGGGNAGAVYLFNGSDGTLISILTGSTAEDQIGSSGVAALTNGNFVIRSGKWDNGAVVNAGAVTWGSGLTGTTGTISAANSLVGVSSDDQIGGIGSVIALPNGNYVVTSFYWDNGSAADAGAVTWGNGATGAVGAVGATNSLIGSTINDYIGLSGVRVLGNSNYVVGNPNWDNGAIVNAGAATWGNGTTGVSGVIASSNSLIGTSAGDQVGLAVTALTNGHYVVSSPQWNNGIITNVGAVTWGNGTSGVAGAVGFSNSMIGTTAEDQIGTAGTPSLNGFVTALPGGNYVVRSSYWDNGSIVNAGAVTWVNGSMPRAGSMSSSPGVVGLTQNDSVGAEAITVLSNGNYVVSCPTWDNGATINAGAVMLCNGANGIGANGPFQSSRSIVGSHANDVIGSGGVSALTNGNYVILSPYWNNGAATLAGAATWCDGVTRTTGIVSSSNSLIGKSGDQVGDAGVVALSGGNYVVRSKTWNNNGETSAGAVTLGNGTIGTSGIVVSSNSLVGSRLNDQVGSRSVVALSNGNYVVSSPQWDNGAVTDVGAVTWASGSSGITGAVSSANSFVGIRMNDQVGFGLAGHGDTELSNGNYIISSPYWQNGVAQLPIGAATWASGATGIVGVISGTNSLTGTNGSQVTALANGNYLITKSGSGFAVGGTTWGNGNTGIIGAFSASNSLVSQTFSEVRSVVVDNVNGHFFCSFPFEGGGRVRLGSLTDGVSTIPTATSVSPNSGSTLGGTPIQIIGMNFLGTTGVTIGGVAATDLLVVNSTRITAKTGPRAAGLVEVVVTSPGGIGSRAALFTYNQPPPAPKIVVTQGGIDISNGATRSFGLIAAGSASDYDFTVSNTGTADLTLTGTPKVAVSGDPDFTVISQPASPITGFGGSGNFTVRFAATGSGLKTASLSIPNNDGNVSPFVIHLNGTVTTASALFMSTIAANSLLTGNDALPDAVPFHDGMTNLLKYAFNMNLAGPDMGTLPPGSGTGGLPSVTSPADAPVGTLCVEFVRRRGSGLTYTPQKSTTLESANWPPLTSVPMVTVINDQWERVTYEEPPSAVPATRCFGRVHVSLP